MILAAYDEERITRRTVPVLGCGHGAAVHQAGLHERPGQRRYAVGRHARAVGGHQAAEGAAHGRGREVDAAADRPSFTDRLRQAADDLTSAQRAHKLELSKVESTWEGIVKGLKQQINDLGADLARVKLGAAQDKAAAEQRDAKLGTKTGRRKETSSLRVPRKR